MNRIFHKLLCRMLIVLTAWMPFQMANASMLGTDQAVAATTHATAGDGTAADRARVLGLLERGDVVDKLQAMGVDPATAKGRVQAMTDEEVGALAQRIDALPAGGNAAGLLIVLIIVGVIWWAVAGGGMRR